jgi:tellurite methyltransferase
MQRLIIGFGFDDEGERIALLDCGHRQHVRHNPPFINRPWTETAAGRQQMIGEQLNCVRCDQSEWPEHFVAYKRTPEFTAGSLPAGLRKDHSTKPGIWAKIVVIEGRLRYRAEPLHIDLELSPRQAGIVVPQVPHSVEPLGAVRFYVEFYREPLGNDGKVGAGETAGLGK